MGTKRSEPIAMFGVNDTAYRLGTDECKILLVDSYCLCCDRFLDEVRYTILMVGSGAIFFKVPQSELEYDLKSGVDNE